MNRTIDSKTGKVVDLSIEQKVAKFFYKNIKDGQITPDYCLELISRTSAAEATVEIQEAKIEELEREVDLLTKEIIELQNKPFCNITAFRFQ